MRLKGLSISKEDFEEKYSVQLTDLEWQLFSKNCENEWETKAIAELRSLAFKSIRTSMLEIGFKLDLDGTQLVFKKTE